jgi:sulfite reductase (ferredoxin)
LGNAYRMIQQLDTLSEQPAFIGRMMNCTGAQTCKLGICLPRGLSKAIQKRLIVSDLDFDAIADFRLNMSGCPNTCGMHHIAQLGFFGKVGRKDGDLYPAYNVLAGAKVAAGQTEYAQRVTDIAAHAIPEFVYQFLREYIAKKDQYATYNAYLDSEGFDLIKALCDQYRDVPAYGDDTSFYTDFGAKKRLSLEQLGTAECSAGMFDMIDVDQKTMKKIIKALPDAAQPAEALKTLLFHASRMLLVTRGLDPKTDTEVFKLFEKHFVQTELVDKQYSAVVLLGLGSSDALVPHADAVVELANAVMALYKGMDDSLKFKLDDAAGSGHTAQHVTQDFRGVACPMNFVKTKLALEALKSGDSLDVLLDDGEPIENVPNSVQQEGHTIVKKEKVENHWQVTIRKA